MAFLNIFRLNPDYQNRVFGLDLMRAFAIIFVVMGHGGNLISSNFPWIKVIDGVELFFVLSGFLIGGILIKLFENNGSFNGVTIKNFWIRRWFRTLPNYYLILVLNILVVWFGFNNGDITQFNWKFFLFIHNFAQPFTGFFWESWSLSIEEWFYILFPIILFIIVITLRSFNTSKKVVFLTAISIFLLIPFLLRVFIASKFSVDEFWLSVKIYKVVIYRLDGIALGLLAAFIKHWYPVVWYRVRNVSFITGIAICYIILYTTWLPNEFSTKVFKIFLIGFGCFLMLPKFDSIKKAPLFITRVFTHISLISYSMYLLNLALVSEIIKKNMHPDGIAEEWALYLLYWSTVLILSTLLYKYYEKPAMNLRDRWDKQKRPIVVEISETPKSL